MTTPRNQRQISLRFLPSAMTVAAICLGLTAVKYAQDPSLSMRNRATWAMALLVLAAVLDALDGRVARVLNATSKMGEEIYQAPPIISSTSRRRNVAQCLENSAAVRQALEDSRGCRRAKAWKQEKDAKPGNTIA